MAGEIAKFFASLGFKADYKELDKFEKRLKSLRGADVRAQAQAGKESLKQTAKDNQKKLGLHSELMRRYRKQEATSLRQLALDRKRLSRQSAAGAFTAQERLELYKRMGQAEATLKQKELDRIQTRGQMEARAYQENARRERLAREARRAEDARRRREIQARGRLEALAYEEEERRNRRRKRRIKRQAGMGLGAAAAMGFGGAMSVQSYQQSLGMERGLTAATGSQELGQQGMDRLVSLADQYGINVAQVGQSYAGVLASARGTSLEGAGATRAFESVMAQSRVMNLSAADTQGVMRSLNQMINKGTIMSEELKNQMSERLPGAMQAAARAAKEMGLSSDGSTQSLLKLMEEGKLVSENFLPYFAEELMKAAENGGALEESMKSTAAAIGRFQTAVWNANRTFNQSGFDKAVGSLFDQTSNSIRKADPLWAALGRMAIGVGKALEVPIEFLGTLGKILGGAMMGADGTLNGEVIALGASFLALSKVGRKIGKNFLLPVAAMMAFTDYMENGITGADDLAVKLGILIAALVRYGNKLKWLAGIAAAHPVVLALLGLTYSEAAGDGTIAAAAGKAGISQEEYKKSNVFNPSQNMSPAEVSRLNEIRRKREAKEAAQMEADRIDRQMNQDVKGLQNSIIQSRSGGNSSVVHNGDIILQGTGKSPEELQQMIINARTGEISRAASSNPITEK